MDSPICGQPVDVGVRSWGIEDRIFVNRVLGHWKTKKTKKKPRKAISKKELQMQMAQKKFQIQQEKFEDKKKHASRSAAERAKYKRKQMEQFWKAKEDAHDKQWSFYQTDKWYYDKHHGPNSYITGTIILHVVKKELYD